VARNSLYSSLTSEVPAVAYIPSSQTLPGWLIGGMYYEIRTLGDPLAFSSAVRQIVHRANPRLPVADLATQVRYIESTIASERTFADLCSCFGLLACSLRASVCTVRWLTRLRDGRARLEFALGSAHSAEE
jgi:hypothetical protein